MSVRGGGMRARVAGPAAVLALALAVAGARPVGEAPPADTMAPSAGRSHGGTGPSAPAPAGPYDILLHPTPRAPGATGQARLVSAASPFGVAVTSDGRARYDVQVTAAGLPAPATLGAYSAYVAWAATTDLSRWVRLGPVANGTTTVGTVDLNKFLLVITAEASPGVQAHAGPTVLHGTSPSGWLQSFLTHPLFRNARW